MIRAGIGGWTFEEWEGTFYPSDLSAKKQLEYASRKLTTIEINGTFYRTQTPSTFRKWNSDTPDDFVFAVKAPRYCVNRKVLSDNGELIDAFMKSGLEELGDKLGPILWQLAGTKKLDMADMTGFFALMPQKLGNRPLRHAIEARHESFVVPEFVELARKHNIAIVFADSDDYPAIPDPTSDFVYARLQRCAESEPTGYPKAEIAKWAKRAGEWQAGGVPKDLKPVSPEKSAKQERDVFAYFISGAKVRAPQAAMAMIEAVK